MYGHRECSTRKCMKEPQYLSDALVAVQMTVYSMQTMAYLSCHVLRDNNAYTVVIDHIANLLLSIHVLTNPLENTCTRDYTSLQISIACVTKTAIHSLYCRTSCIH